MGQVKQKFLGTPINHPLIWLRYIDDVLFIWTHGEKELEKFTSSFNSLTPNLNFTYESSKKDMSFLDLKVSLSKLKLSTDCIQNSLIVTSTYTILLVSRAYKTVNCL